MLKKGVGLGQVKKWADVGLYVASYFSPKSKQSLSDFLAVVVKFTCAPTDRNTYQMQDPRPQRGEYQGASFRLASEYLGITNNRTKCIRL